MPGPSRSDSTDSSLFAAAAGPWFERLLPAAAAFWAPQVLPPSDRVILVDIQATENFHYRPLWDPAHELYDVGYSALRLTDPYSFLDPRQYYYAPYVISRAAAH